MLRVLIPKAIVILRAHPIRPQSCIQWGVPYLNLRRHTEQKNHLEEMQWLANQSKSSKIMFEKQWFVQQTVQSFQFL